MSSLFVSRWPNYKDIQPIDASHVPTVVITELSRPGRELPYVYVDRAIYAQSEKTLQDTVQKMQVANEQRRAMKTTDQRTAA